jgi:polygalacturonase
MKKIASCFALLALASCSAAIYAQTLATGDTRTVSTPSFPTVCKTVTAQYTAADRATPPSSDDTTLIQNALTACAGTGKSVVLAASGSYNAFYSGLLTVNGEGLVVSSGVTLYGGTSYSSAKELILVKGSNAFIGGPGTIDGRGDLISGTPRLVQTSSASNFTIYDITLKQAAHPNLYIEGGTGATVYNVTIWTPASRHNADGIDIDSISNVSVINSIINAGDDGIAVKTNSGAASNITVSGTKVYGTHGLSIGSQTMYGVTNILFKNDYVYGYDQLTGATSTDANAINIKTDYDCGGAVKQVTYENICITKAKHLIVLNTNYGACTGKTGTPVFSNIVINGVKSTSSLSSAYSLIEGYNASNPITAYVANISLDTNTQNSAAQYATVYLDNVNGWAPTGTGLTTKTFTLSGSVPTCSF